MLGPIAVQYDTISILTLPAFHWISVPYGPRNPRHGLTCVPVGGGQILTIGGLDSAVNDPSNGPLLGAFSGSPDPFTQGLGIFDMTTLKWAEQYTAQAPVYEQSHLVQQFYSQSQQ